MSSKNKQARLQVYKMKFFSKLMSFLLFNIGLLMLARYFDKKGLEVNGRAKSYRSPRAREHNLKSLMLISLEISSL